LEPEGGGEANDAGADDDDFVVMDRS